MLPKLPGTTFPQICPIAFFSKTGYNKEHHAEHTAGIGKGF